MLLYLVSDILRESEPVLTLEQALRHVLGVR